MTKEQLIISECFLNFTNGRGGKYIEVGCNDNQQESNASMLLQTGWYGYLVDCSPSCMGKLRKLYGTDQRIQLLQYALSDRDGSLLYNETIHLENGESVINPIQVQAMSMRRFLSIYGNDIDYLVLNVDVPDMNYGLLTLINNDFFHRLKGTCIKHDGHQDKIKEKLMPFGFKVIHVNENNIILSK